MSSNILPTDCEIPETIIPSWCSLDSEDEIRVGGGIGHGVVPRRMYTNLCTKIFYTHLYCFASNVCSCY